MQQNDKSVAMKTNRQLFQNLRVYETRRSTVFGSTVFTLLIFDPRVQ